MIPQDKKITIIPNLLIKYINNIILDIKGDIDVDQDIIRNKYQLYIINEVYNRINELFNNCSFWKNIMNIHYCDFKYKNGIKKGLFCGKSIDIVCEDGKNYYKCSRHISKKYYKPIKKKDSTKLCLALNNKGEKCNSYKKYGNYCCYHKDYLFFDEISLFCDIKYIVPNITEQDIDILDIKYNMEVCLENNCFNKSVINEDLCNEHIEEQRSVHENIEINTIKEINDFQFTFQFDNKNIKKNILPNELDYILYNIDETIKEIKEDNNIFIKKCNETINESIINKIDKDIILDISKIENVYEVITNIISNKTYININYLEKSLITYNNKFKEFKKEIKEDFPKYYKYIKGYFEIMEKIFDGDIKRNIEMAKIKSKFI